MQPNNYQAYLSQNPISGGGGGSASGGPQPNGLEKLLPTIGSVGGGILGALIPGLGETGIGEVGGSAAGGALGRHIENMLTGQTGGELGAAAEGGIGAGVGGLLGKAVGGVGKGALGFLANKTAAPELSAAEQATKNLAEYTAPSDELLKGERFSNAAGEQKYGTTMGMMQKMGVENTPESLKQAADTVTGNPTGAGAFLSKKLGEFAGKAGDINDTQLIPSLNTAMGGGFNLLDREASRAGGEAVDWLSSKLADAVKSSGREGTVYDSNKLLQLIKDIGKKSEEFAPSDPRVTVNVNDAARANMLRSAQKELEDTLYERGGVNDMVKNYHTTSEEEAQIKKAAPTPAVAQHVIDSLNNSQSAAELRGAQTPFVRASKIADLVNFAKERPNQPLPEEGPHAAEGLTRAAVNGLMGSAPDKIKAIASVSGGFIPALNKIAQGGSDVLGKIPMGRIGAGAGAGLATLGGSAAAAGGGPGDLTQGGGGMPPAGPMGAMAGGGGGQPGGPTLANGAPLTNPNILAQLDTMMATDPYLAQSLAPVVQQLAGPVTAAQAAQQMLPEYQSTLAQGTQGGGPLGFLLAKISGALTGGPAAQVGPQQQAIQALLTRAGAPGMQVPGLFANPAGTAAGMAPTASVLGALGGQ